MLDTLSGGRLDLGAGRGATLQEMSLCGVDPERTYLEVEESLNMISRMWEEDEFSWDGELKIAPHPILPRPVQMPHPPLFMACSKKAHRAAGGRVRRRRAGARLRRHRRGPRVPRPVPRDVREAHRRAVRLQRGERPLLRAVADHRARRRRRGVPDRRARPTLLRRVHRALVRRRARAARRTPRATTTSPRWRATPSCSSPGCTRRTSR